MTNLVVGFVFGAIGLFFIRSVVGWLAAIIRAET